MVLNWKACQINNSEYHAKWEW